MTNMPAQLILFYTAGNKMCIREAFYLSLHFKVILDLTDKWRRTRSRTTFLESNL